MKRLLFFFFFFPPKGNLCYKHELEKQLQVGVVGCTHSDSLYICTSLVHLILHLFILVCCIQLSDLKHRVRVGKEKKKNNFALTYFV